MATAVDKIKIALDIKDSGAADVVKKLESSFRGLANAANQLDAKGISKVRDGIQKFDTAGKRNINTIQSQISALTALRNEAQIGSSQFKQLTADIEKYGKELQKAQGKKRSGGRLVGAAKSVGAIAAAGVFGGPEGAIGAGIGALAGGPVGAAVGGAVGAQVGQIRQALGATAEYQARLTKLRIALKGVTESQGEYQEGLNFIQQTTKDFAVPQEVVTKQFTKLQASVSGAGGNLADTKTAFNGIVAAVRATGGSLQDVDSALTATAQVFSKGKVSAEELRQQLGERLPGAFTLFAESMGKTPQELDKALERGEVSLQDFQKFAETLFEKYGETAKIIASSPEAAGDRLKVVLDSLSENVGELLKPVGSAFQETFINIVEFIDMAIGRLKLFLELGAVGTKKKVDRLSADITRLLRKEEEFNRIDRQAGRSVIRSSDRRLVQHQLEQKRQQLQAAQASLRDLTGFNIVAEDPGQKKGLPGIDPNKPGTSKRAPASQQMVALTRQLADQTGKIGDRELINLKYLIAKQRILDNNLLPATDRQVKLNEALANYNKDIARLDKKEATALEKALGAKVKFEQLEANILAKKMGLTDEQVKEQLLQANINSLTERFKDLLIESGLATEEVERRIRGLAEAMVELKEKAKDPLETFKKGLKEIFEEALNINQALAERGVQAVQEFGDAFADFVATGKANFRDFANSIIKDLARIFAKRALFQGLSLIPGVGSFLGLGGGGGGGGGFSKTGFYDPITGKGTAGPNFGFANGAAFAKNKIVPYAMGGIVNKPTLFQYANGGSGRFGLMGEAGAEAILPLRRGASGKLGVEASGAAMGNITVNVDAAGSSVEGDASQANQLGKAIGVAVQQELIKQKRPGGLLAS